MSLLEILFGIVSGTALMIGISSTLAVMIRGASETSAAHTNFVSRSAIMRIERDVARASRVNVSEDGILSLVIPDTDWTGEDDSVLFEYEPGLQELVRKLSGHSELLLNDVQAFEATCLKSYREAASETLDVVSTNLSLHSCTGSGSSTKIGAGELLHQPLLLPTSTTRAGAQFRGVLIERIELSLSKHSTAGTIGVYIMKQDAAGNPDGEPVLRWTIDEEKMGNSMQVLIATEAKLLDPSQSYSLVIMPLDSSGGVKARIENFSVSAKLENRLDGSTSDLGNGLISTVYGYTVDRVGTWSIQVPLVSEVSYRLAARGIIGGAASGTINVPLMPTAIENCWEFSGLWRNLPTDAGGNSQTFSLRDWNVSGSLANSDGQACQLTGDLTSQTDQPSPGLVHAHARLSASALSSSVLTEIGVGNPITTGYQILAQWSSVNNSESQVQIWCRVGEKLLPIETIRQPFPGTLDIEVFANPIDQKLAIWIEGKCLGCWDLNEMLLGLSRNGLSSNNLVQGIRVSTGTSSVAVDHLIVEHLVP